MARYTDESIQRLRDALDIVSVVESYTPLKRSGTALKALCPFHNEKTPSFTVNPERQIFKCFGCGEGGDVFRFVMKIEGVDFPEALQMLADRAGLELEREGGPVDDGAARQRASEKQALFWITSKTMAYFEACLADEREGRAARAYLADRGFTPETLRAWRVGWAPEGYGGLTEYLVRESGGKRAQAVEYAVRAGVLRRGREDPEDTYEFFRGRVIFPILDLQQRAVGFGGRLLREDPDRPVGKYINTPETPLFNKSRVLYGLHAAAKEMRLTGTAVVVEGYTDVIMCHQHGIRNVVGTLGTALTREHVGLLRRYCETVVARFDADQAGAQATDRAIRTFVEEDMPLKIVRSEAIKDACEFLPREGADAFREELEAAEDAFGYHFRRTLGRERLESVDERAAAVGEAMALVNSSPNALKREMLRQQVADMAGVPEASLPQPAARPARPQPGEGRRRGLRHQGGEAPAAGEAAPAPAAEEEDLPLPQSTARRHEPRLIEYMLESREWCDAVCAVYPPEEFHTDLLREAAEEIHDGWNEAETLDPTGVFQRIQHPEASRLLTDLVMGERPALTAGELGELLVQAQRWRREEELAHLREDLRRAQAAGEKEETARLAQALVERKRELDHLLAEALARAQGPAA